MRKDRGHQAVGGGPSTLARAQTCSHMRKQQTAHRELRLRVSCPRTLLMSMSALTLCPSASTRCRMKSQVDSLMNSTRSVREGGEAPRAPHTQGTPGKAVT
jgi:hypothetical protein